MLTKIREALAVLAVTSPIGSNGHQSAALALGELMDAEKALREALAMKVWAVAGLSAFHGRLCSEAQAGPVVSDEAARCADPKCRAWAAAVTGEAGPDEVLSLLARVVELEDAVRAQAATMLDVQQSHEEVRNAALDEAASDLDAYAAAGMDAAESIILNSASERIRALKKEAP